MKPSFLLALDENGLGLFETGRLSTRRAIELLEQYGVETPEGLVQAPAGRVKRATVDRYLALWGFDHDRLVRAPPAMRFEARHSNALWQLDLSPSDLKQIEMPSWVEPGRGPQRSCCSASCATASCAKPRSRC